jgi:hypothetical protein
MQNTKKLKNWLIYHASTWLEMNLGLTCRKTLVASTASTFCSSFIFSSTNPMPRKSPLAVAPSLKTIFDSHVISMLASGLRSYWHTMTLTPLALFLSVSSQSSIRLSTGGPQACSNGHPERQTTFTMFCWVAL